MTVNRFVALAGATLVLTACQTGEAAEDSSPRFITAQASRGTLELRAEATGAVEPVREVEVKSKASGEVVRLHADVGDRVERGAILAEIDPRDVRNRFNQTEADLAVARAQLEIAQAQLERQRQLLEAQVITQAEFENATLSFANAQAALVRARTNHELAELQLADVNIRAPMDGTIIQKNVEEGVVIQSASSNVSGGTALFVMADLSDMQVRTLVDETDMGELQSGLSATVTVEAYPDRIFQGLVEKIEPMATVDQNVTMFPVIVSLDNRSDLLKPGMNAEVVIFIDQATDVVIVPNNAVVQPSDVGPAAMALGLELDDIALNQFMGGGGGARSGGPAGARPGGRPGARPDGPAGAGDPGSEGGSRGADAVPADVAAYPGAAGDSSPTDGPTARNRVPGERETRPGAVFVLGADSIPEPRLVELGIGDWDSVEIVSGLVGDETLVVVGPAQLQAQQAEFMERMRSRFGGSGPFGGRR